MIKRKVTYRLYPSGKQNHQMIETLRLHQKLYNAALEQRIEAYSRRGVSVTYRMQAKELTLLRSEFPEYKALNAQSEQVTLKRLDLAFKSFFQRFSAGKTHAGFPRFKALERFKGWGFAAHGDGWKFLPNATKANGTIRISGVGNLQARGRARFRDEEKSSREPGSPKTMEVVRKAGKWYASVTFDTTKPYRASGTKALGIDWGTLKFLSIVTDAKDVFTITNPRHLKKVEIKLARVQRELSKKKKGSTNRQKAKAKLGRIHERLAFKREDFLHRISSDLIGKARFIATEDLSIKTMTASRGRNKAGLNRSILDTSPGKFFQMLEYKAADAGIPYVEVPTRRIKPSQTCSGCSAQEKKLLSERRHQCSRCGLDLDRDVNAGYVILNYALTGFVTGQELALGVEEENSFPMKHETPSISEQVRQAL